VERPTAMSFEYISRDSAAVDRELGLEISLDRHFTDSDVTTLLVRALPDGPSWPLTVEYEKGERAYQSKSGPRMHKFDVAGHLRRRAVEPIAETLTRIQPHAGYSLDREAWMEAIRQGVFTYMARGGAFLEIIPDLTVSIDR
jgi:hypothetical protein